MSAAAAAPASPAAKTARLPGWWPLAALTLLAAVLRLSTLGLQSFWYDEAYTPLHVLHPSLSSTLSAVSHTENSPPLWYLVAWVFDRLFGDGAVSLRMPSALAGIALVPVAWGIGGELAGRRAAVATAALVSVSPLFVWYSQEARVYELYALTAAVAMLCFLRALARPARGRMAAFALAGALALLTHYFAVFLLAGMALWLLAVPRTRRAALPALASIALVGAALVPLLLAQGGRNTSWIGAWALSSRLEAIPQYFLTGESGSPLGHAVELLVALPLLAACALGLFRMLERPPSRRTPEEARYRTGAAIAAWLAACGVLIPLVLALAGEDYLAPRNVLAAMVPVAALIAVLGTWPRAGAAGAALLALGAAGLLAVTVDVDLSPRLQRGDWSGLAASLPRGAAARRAVSTELLGSAPLQYYLGGLRRLAPHERASVREVVAAGEANPGAPAARGRRSRPLAPPGFVPAGETRVHGLLAVRFLAPAPRVLTEEQLRRAGLPGATWVLTPGDGRTAR